MSGASALDDWLTAIGLGGSRAAFRAHDVAIDQLAELTDDDLRELGLTIGQRKTFRRGLAARPATAPARAERRPLTMMFVDLVDSSALAERLEPEDLMEVIRRYREFAATAVTRRGGMVGRLVGDGILAYFCYPIATENDPERAARAALDIVRGLPALDTPAGAPLEARVGIATGQVIIGDLYAGGADLRSIIGSPPNLAARLQGLAPPGGVVIAEETYVRIRAGFDCAPLDGLRLKGIPQTQQAWRLLGEATRRPRERSLPTAFHGRAAELATLAGQWGRALAGEGGLAVVTGEAGIGKSRLIAQFLEAEVARGGHVMRLSGSALDEDSALHPVVSFLRLTAALELGDTDAMQLEKLRAILAGDAAAREAALPVFAELVGIPMPGPATPPASPAILRERTLACLVEQLLAQASRRPVFLLFEDLHWLDPTSLELLGRIVAEVAKDRVAGRPVMVLATVRDGFAARWEGLRPGMVIPLLPLSAADVGQMVRSLLAGRAVPPHVGRLIAQRTDGVPLFVEAVARELLLSAAWDDLGAFPNAAIPASLRESLMARLDRSGVAKRVAQIVAVIGRTARLSLLASVAVLPSSELGEPLAALLDAGVLVHETLEGVDSYRFSHALLRDAAYDSLLRDERRRLHLRVAAVLGEVEQQTLAQQPELLAMHLAEGNELAAAAAQWGEAARRSLARSALTEATRLLQHGLDALARLEPTPAVRRLRVELSGLMGPALIGLNGPGSTEAQALYADAYALCSDMPEEKLHFPIYWGWWRVSQDFHTWLARSDAILHRAVAHDDPEFLLQAHHSNWASHYHAGQFAQCCSHIEAGLAIYAAGDYRHHATLYGNHDPRVCAHGELAQVLWLQGRGRSAVASDRAATDWAETLDHHGSRVHALDISLLHHVYRRDYAVVHRRAGDLVDFTSEHAMSDHRSKGMIFRGWITATQEDAAKGLRALRDGLQYQRDGTAREDFPVYLCLLAEAQLAAERPDLAVGELTEALAEFDRLGLHSWRPEVRRMMGEAMLAADPGATQQAERQFAAAAEIAATQGAAMLGLRTAVSQARLDLRLDRAHEASARMAAALAAVAEDDGGADLREARLMEARVRARLGVAPRA